jgi:hypothetical protein
MKQDSTSSHKSKKQNSEVRIQKSEETHPRPGDAIGSASQCMMGIYRFQALKARNSKTQGEGCEAAETLGERRRNGKPCKGLVMNKGCILVRAPLWAAARSKM